MDNLPPLILADPATIWLSVVAVSLIATGVALALQKPPEQELQDVEKKAIQGGYLPLLIGRRKVTPVIAFVGETTPVDQDSGAANSGKGGLGKKPSQPRYESSATHLLYVGPGGRILGIYENDERIDFEGDITPASYPSGSFIDLGQTGAFYIHWGERDYTPVNGNSLVNVPLDGGGSFDPRLNYAVRIDWVRKELDGSPRWPLIRYDCEGPVYSSLSSTAPVFPLSADAVLRKVEEIFGGPIGSLPGNADFRFKIADVSVAGEEVTFRIQDTSFGQVSGNLFQDFTDYFPPERIVRLNGDLTNASSPVSIVGVVPNYVLGEPSYYRILSSSYDPTPVTIPGGSLTTGTTLITVEPAPLAIQYVFPAAATGAGTDATLQPLIENQSKVGVNLAHALDQLMFSSWPHGRGLPRKRFDLTSLEKVSQLMANEGGGLRGSVVLEDGETYQSAITKLLEDMGVAISWDPESGLHVFEAPRRGDTLPTLPQILINGQIERQTRLSPSVAEKLTFNFDDATRNFRNTTITAQNDGSVLAGQAPSARSVKINSTNDPGTAVAIARRRENEEWNVRDARIFPVGRDARYLRAGTGFLYDGKRWRIVSTKYDVLTSAVELRAVRDGFGRTSESFSSFSQPEGFLDTGFLGAPSPQSTGGQPPEAQDVAVFEAPRGFGRSGRPEIVVAYGRGSADAVSHDIHLSRDGSTFNFQVSDTSPWAVGELLDPIPALSGSFLSHSPFPEAVFEVDADRIESLAGDEAAWRAGRQVLVAVTPSNGVEVLYLREISLVSGSTYTLEGLIRARQGTQKRDLVAGTKIYVNQAHRITPIESPIIQIGQPVQVKVQPFNRSGGRSLAQVTSAASPSIRGDSVRGLPVSNIRVQGSETRAWQSGDLVLEWSYRNGATLTGAGNIGFGVPQGSSGPEGSFRVRIYDDSQNLVGTYGSVSSSVTIPESDLDESLDPGPSTFSIGVVNLVGGLESDEVRQTFERLP